MGLLGPIEATFSRQISTHAATGRKFAIEDCYVSFCELKARFLADLWAAYVLFCDLKDREPPIAWSFSIFDRKMWSDVYFLFF